MSDVQVSAAKNSNNKTQISNKSQWPIRLRRIKKLVFDLI